MVHKYCVYVARNGAIKLTRANGIGKANGSSNINMHEQSLTSSSFFFLIVALAKSFLIVILPLYACIQIRFKVNEYHEH